MGKTTTEYINKVMAQREQCHHFVRMSHENTQEMLGLKKTLDGKLYNLGKALEFWQGVEGKGLNPNLFPVQPGDKKLHAECQAAQARYDELLAEQKTKASAEIKALIPGLVTLTDQFEAYVKKKEKAWFGSKNSVPKAKEMIADTRAYVGALKHMIEAA
jgi:hypothetical protein